MSLRPARRRATSLVAAALLPLGLTACGAGLQAQTYQVRNQADNTNVAVGALALRNVAIESPGEQLTYSPGDDADLRFTVVNDGSEDDELVEITTDAASSVQVQVGGEEGDLQVPALDTTGEEAGAVLTGLTRELRTGEYVEMTFRFRENGSVTTLVPVSLPEEIPTRSVAENWHPETDVLQRGLMGTAEQAHGEEGEALESEEGVGGAGEEEGTGAGETGASQGTGAGGVPTGGDTAATEDEEQ